MGLLSLLLILPLVAMALILALPHAVKSSFKYIALAFTAVQLCLTIYMYQQFDPAGTGINTSSGFQFVEQTPWIYLSLGNLGRLEIDYFLGVDGISLPLLLLSSFIMLMAIGASWNIRKSLKGYFALLMLLNMAVMGVFSALDFFLFYIFYEVMLFPLYFLIGIWGPIGSMQQSNFSFTRFLARYSCCSSSLDCTFR